MSFILLPIFTIIACGVAGAASVGEWKDWSVCTKTCGTGSKQKLKICDADIDDPWVCGRKTITCNVFSCDDPLLSVKWSVCNATCDGHMEAISLNGTIVTSISCNNQCDLFLPSCNKKVVFIVDRSGEINLREFQIQKQFVRDIISSFGPGVDVSLIASSTEADTYQSLSSGNTPEMTKMHLKDFVYDSQTTFTVSAMKAALNQVKHLTNAVVVLIAEGGSVVDGDIDVEAVDIATVVKGHAKIIGIKVSQYANPELILIANDIIDLESPSDLPSVVRLLALKICEKV